MLELTVSQRLDFSGNDNMWLSAAYDHLTQNFGHVWRSAPVGGYVVHNALDCFLHACIIAMRKNSELQGPHYLRFELPDYVNGTSVTTAAR